MKILYSTHHLSDHKAGQEILTYSIQLNNTKFYSTTCVDSKLDSEVSEPQINNRNNNNTKECKPLKKIFTMQCCPF